jgi:hypothetical protein
LIRDAYAAQFGFEKIIVTHQPLVILRLALRQPRDGRVVVGRRRVVVVRDVRQLAIAQGDLRQPDVGAEARRVHVERAAEAVRRPLVIEPLEEGFADAL